MSRLVFSSIAKLRRTMEYKASEPWCMPRSKHTSASPSPRSNKTAPSKSRFSPNNVCNSLGILIEGFIRVMEEYCWLGVGHVIGH